MRAACPTVLLAGALLCAATPASARFLHRYHHDRRFLARGHSAPNETEPAKSLTVLAHATAGVYVSVGTERSFIGAAVTPAITHLLIVDYDSRVVAFARTNIALLQAASSRADYVRLRLHGSLADWKQAAARAKVEPYLLPYLIEQAHYADFREALKERGFIPLNDPRFTELTGEFRFVNYLYEDALYARLSTLAKAGRVQAETLDLATVDEARELVADLGREHLQISVLDLSNCWMDEYVPSPAFESTLTELAHGTSPSGLLVLTNLAHDYLQRLPQLRDPANPFHSDYVWSYYGFPLPAFASLEVSRRFARSLKRPDPGGAGPAYQPGRVNSVSSAPTLAAPGPPR